MLNELLCLLLGHKYRVAQELTGHSRRLGCTRCGEAFAMSDDVQCVNHWDDRYHRLYESHGVKIEYQPLKRPAQRIAVRAASAAPNERRVRALFQLGENMNFDEIEDCMPEGGNTDNEGNIVSSAQWLHDFANSIEKVALTAANERIKELEAELAASVTKWDDAATCCALATNQITAERELSDKLEKALKLQPRRTRVKWKDGIDIDVPADGATQARDDALAEVAAIRKGEPV